MKLARWTLWSMSRLSHQLSRMERRGLVRREEQAGNVRATDTILTDDGLRLIKKAAPKHVESVHRHFMAVLTGEQIDFLGAASERVIRH